MTNKPFVNAETTKMAVNDFPKLINQRLGKTGETKATHRASLFKPVSTMAIQQVVIVKSSGLLQAVEIEVFATVPSFKGTTITLRFEPIIFFIRHCNL